MDFRDFAAAAKQGPDATLDYYVKNYQGVSSVLANKLIRKGEIRLESATGIDDKVAASLVLNDITSTTFRDAGEIRLIMLEGEAIIKTFGSLQLRIVLPANPTDAFRRAIESGELAPTFVMPSTDMVSAWLSEFEPLIESGRILPRPERALLHLEANLPNGSRQWSMVAASSNSPSDTWVLNDDTSKVDAVIKLESKPQSVAGEEELFELLMPFLQGIDLRDLNLILDDEHDVIDEFRIALRDVVREAYSKGENVDDILRDHLRPKLARMHRRFLHITNMNSMKLGSAIVGTAVMGLFTAHSGGMTAALAAIGGAGGLALVAKEAVNAFEANANRREEDLYLLWRLKGHKK